MTEHASTLKRTAAEFMKPRPTVTAAVDLTKPRRRQPRWKPDWERIRRKDADRPVVPNDRQTYDVIRGVIMSGCAGYAVRPPWTKVVEALATTTPDPTQARALKAFLIEAREENIEYGWQRGEFSMVQIIERVLMFQTTGDTRTIGCVESWGAR